jgi:hypothetical protein
VKGFAAAASIAALVTASASLAAVSTASPSTYRAKLNGICRANTVKLKTLDATMKRALQAKDAHAWGLAFGQTLRVILSEDAAIEAEPIPVQLRAHMVPTVGLLKQADGIIHHAVQRLLAGDLTAGITVMSKQLGSLAAPANKHLDAAGLRDCGSNQSLSSR